MEELERMFLRLYERIEEIYDRFDQVANILESLETRIRYLEDQK